MTDEVISKETLQGELDVLKLNIPKRKWRYYYIESIQNFIYHLDSFSSERTQERVAGKIRDYLDLLRKRTTEEYDVHDLAKQLFPVVWKLSREYVDFLGFIKIPSYFFHIAPGVILFFILKSSLDPWIALGTVSIIAITTTAYSAFK